MDKGLHPEPGYREENHNDVFKKKMASAGIAVVCAKVRCFRSVTHPCHTEISMTYMTQSNSQVWMRAPPRVTCPSHLPLDLSLPTPPRGEATIAAMSHAGEPLMGTTSLGRYPGIPVLGPRPPSTTQHTKTDR